MRLWRLALTLLLALLGQQVEAVQAAPNIVYIEADDLGYGHLGSYGQTRIKTPFLDKMAVEGLRFTNYYAGNTVCAPARASLLTGRDPGHARIRSNGFPKPLQPEDVTIAEVLKERGYTTAVIGKWALGGLGTSGFPGKQGFDLFVGYLRQVNAHYHYPAYLWKNDTPFALNGRYAPDVLTETALDFVGDNRDRSFFLYLAYAVPHSELRVPADSSAAYDFPETPWRDYRYGTQPQPRAVFAGMVSRLDRDVGRILALLEELGLDQNTLVMFSSDNGASGGSGLDPEFFDATAGLRGLKGDLYEGGLRVPLIARWPGVIAPGVSDHVAAAWDVLPTLADLVNVEPPPTEGLSFLPTLLGRSQSEHDYLYWEYPDLLTKQAVRFGNWKALRASPGDAIELYDLATDPSEARDRATKEPTLVGRAETLMAEARGPSMDWPLRSRTAWTWLHELKRMVGPKVREIQGYFFPGSSMNYRAPRMAEPARR